MRKSAPRSTAWATPQNLWLLGTARRFPIPIRPALLTSRPASLPCMLHPPRSSSSGAQTASARPKDTLPRDPVLYISRSDVNRDRKPQSVHQEVPLTPFDGLVGIVAAWVGRFLDGLDALAIYDGRRGIGGSAHPLACRFTKGSKSLFCRVDTGSACSLTASKRQRKVMSAKR